MARKANPIDHNILASIEDAQIVLARATPAIRESDGAVFSRQTGHRSFKFRT